MKWIVSIVLIALLAVGGWFGYQRFVVEPQLAAAAPAYEQVAVERGTIASTVSATGSIEPEAELSLSFRAAGRVDQVLVVAGQSVAEGQLLAQLDTRDFELAREQALISQQISQAQLAKLESPVKESDLAAAQAGVEVSQASVAGAEAALASAQASYRQLLAGATEAELTVQQAQLRQAEASVRQAQSAYNQVKDFPGVGALPQALQLEQATNAYELAQAQYALATRPANQAQVAQALSAIAQAETGVRQARSGLLTAQNSLQRLLDGPADEDLAIARAQVRQADLSVQQTENSIANARLVAPISGVISLVNLRQGELYSGQPAIRLTDLASFHMTVLVDEIDVRQVAVGQTVRLSLDALPDQDLTGQVTSVSPTADSVGGVVAYSVEIVPDATDAPLRAGMSATAIITTAQVDNVFLVPNRFIQPDRETGKFYVYKMAAGQPALQEVELGLRNDRSSQILAGLTDGDQLALVSLSAEERLQNAFFGGGN